MSETEQAAVAGPGAGAMLRAARESAGVHIASLAVALKVPVARLEALEAERFDLLPDPPFVRALAGSVCRALKMDPAPVLARLPQKARSSLNDDIPRTDGATFRTTSSAPARLAGAGAGLRHPVLWVVLTILLAAAALLLVPSERLDAWTQALTGQAAGDAAQMPPGAVPEVPVLPGEPPVAAVAPMGPESSRGDGNGGVAAPAESAPASAAPAAGLQSSASLSNVPPAPASGTVSFSASAESWIRVTDSRGATVTEKVLQAGGSMSADGVAPLTVVVGNARATAVKVRGQDFDLSAIARNNVARFEVR